MGAYVSLEPVKIETSNLVRRHISPDETQITGAPELTWQFAIE